jgi:penicillin-binding protein 1C
MVVLGGIAVWVVPLPAALHPESSFIVRYEDGDILRAYLTADEKWRIWMPLTEMDPRLVAATVCYEDRYYWWHPGVNPGALARALYQNVRARRVRSGGSTITMQVARMAERKRRTVRSKILEMLRAVQYEARMGKRRILENYLNRAPYGGNYEGVASASLAYYGKAPTQLTASEIAYLVSLPQSPTQRKPGPRMDERARDRVLARLKQCGIVSESEYREALAADLPERVRGLPVRAPLTADYFRAKYGSPREAHTTLSRATQRLAENIVETHRLRIRALGAYNAAVVVMENETRKVRALVGTLDYWDEEHAGKMNAFDVERSPGSALKPFLYALALQEGEITTATLLEDIPAPVSGFLPANFSGTYRGLVTAEFALSHSLNYPFVRLLRQVSVEKFLALMDRLGLRRPSSFEYGLTAITGGLEVRLLDLTNAYVTLGRGGRYGAARTLARGGLTERKLLNPGAVTLTLEALSKREGRDAPRHLNLSEGRGRPVVYWKTGTSWGRRDAWSLGLTADYTVGVWVGNLSGRGSESIVGANAAGPLLFDLLYALGSRTPKMPEADDDIETVEVCALSGMPRNEHCGEVKRVRVVRDRIPSRQCPFHRAFIVERKTGDLACPTKDDPEGALVQKVLAVVPSLARALMSLPPEPVPALASSCGGAPENTALQMLKPTSGATYLMTTGVRRASHIPLEAYTTEKSDRIYWFVNGRYVARTRSGETYRLSPEAGTLRIVAADSSGNTARATVTVSSPLPVGSPKVEHATKRRGRHP